MIRRFAASILASFALFLSPALAPALAAPASTQPAEAARFMRLVDDGKVSRLECSTISLKNADGVTVDLVAAVHIGEKSYYDALNKQFAGYDAVLYELVKAKDAPVPAPGQAQKSDHPVARLQRVLKDVLGLDYQLDCIDYTKANFIHADMTAEVFTQLQKEKGESMATIMLKQVLKALREPDQATVDRAGGGLGDVMSLLTKPDMERQLKRLLAHQMNDVEAAAAMFGQDSVILTERNKTAVKVLKDTLGKGKKHIAIFYGAAHMPDLSERLTQMGFKQTGTTWVAAWDLTIRPDQPSAIDGLIDRAVKAVEKAVE